MSPARLSEPSNVLCGAVDYALVTGDVTALCSSGIPCASALVGGDLERALAISRSDGGELSAVLYSALSGDAAAVAAAPPALAYVAAVGSFMCFVRANFTGPVLPASTRPVPVVDLSVDGEDPPVEPQLAHLLLVAEELLLKANSELDISLFPCARWWAARVALAHHAILARVTPTVHRWVFESFSVLLGRASSAAKTLTRAAPVVKPFSDDADGFGEDDCAAVPDAADAQNCDCGGLEPELAALANLELCMAQRQFFDLDGAKESLKAAGDLAGVVVDVRGQLGVRTKFQEMPTSQLVARVHRKLQTTRVGENESVFTHDFPAGAGSSSSPEPRMTHFRLPRNVPLDDSDLLGFVKLVDEDSHEDGARDSESSTALGPVIEVLTPLEQAIVLAHASYELSRSAGHELTNEQASPYVWRVLAAADSAFGTSSILQVQALSLRTRFEGGRGRYMERNMTQLEELGRFMAAKGSASDDGACALRAATERGMMLFASGLPPQWELKKLLAIALGQLGLVKSAMLIFEELELWDELVDCHRLVGNLGVAEELVRDQLNSLDDATAVRSEGDAEVEPPAKAKAVARRKSRRPRLLCVLGDILRDPDYFRQAWEESNQSYGRAKRSLGRYALERNEWVDAVEHFREALAVNPLSPEIWYLQGCACLRIPDMHQAAVAFTNVVRDTPDNAEAWSNLGQALHELGRTKASMNAFLQAAGKHRENWRMWENVLLVATELRASANIVRACDRLMELRGKDGVHGAALVVAVDELIRIALGQPSSTAGEECVVPTENEKAGGKHTSRTLLKVLGRATALVSSNAMVWEAYARLYEVIPGTDSKRKCAECRQRQLRALQGKSGWQKELAPFRVIAQASQEYARAAVMSGDPDILHSAGLHVESVITQSTESFGANPTYLLLLEARDTLEAA